MINVRMKMINRIINFDNAATSYPKPECVKTAVSEAVEKLGGNAGRGNHILAMRSSEAVYDARCTAADFFGAAPENVIFCSSCTHALNTVISSLADNGAHIIISSLEHNSVLRPLAEREKKGKIKLSIARVYDSDDLTVSSFESLIRPDTKAVICCAAGNVTGQILPVKRIASVCMSKNICFIADGAQACGKIPLRTGNGINFICTSGHKGLFGLSGTGLLISDGKYSISPLITGGTGSGSLEALPETVMPDSFESGTLNIPGIISVKTGIEYIRKLSMKRIFEYEENLCRLFCRSAERIPGIKIYRTAGVKYVPIVSFTIKNIDQNELTDHLSSEGFCLRAGYHCSALAHRNLGTSGGTIRLSPSVFNTENDIKKLCFAIKNTL